MSDAKTLHNRSCKDLAALARRRGIRGWHSMRKDQLVKALLKVGRNGSASSKPQKATQVAATRRSTSTATSSRASRPAPQPARPAAKPKDPRVQKRLAQAKEKVHRWKDLAYHGNGKPRAAVKDRLVVLVRDAYWLHACWELTRRGIERAEAAMGQDWHSARPVLRVFEVTTGGTTATAERPWRTIEIHGGVNNWYIDVVDPPKSYRVDIGYLAANGRFFALCRSNVVTTPAAGVSDAIDGNWAAVAENFEKVYALSGGYAPEGGNHELQQLFEERLRRPMGSPMTTRFGAGAEVLAGRKRDFHFEVDAELIVYGSTQPDAHVTLQGDPVRLRPDGTFTVRFSMPNCRQVIPAVASSANGLEQQTIVLAVERNTKTMEPLVRDSGE